MNFKTVKPDESLALFVKDILIFEEKENNQKAVLPFFADGYPGLMFQDTKNGLFVSPHNKQMPVVFLYGQTIKPIELIIDGNYELIVFQLYPFVLKSLFHVEPESLNDACYDLEKPGDALSVKLIKELKRSKGTSERIVVLSALLKILIKNKQEEIDLNIAHAIKTIIAKKGQVLIKDLYEDLYLTERTFERRFFKSVGVTAKQFSKIIQFQQSLEQLTAKDYSKLTDVVYANGFADQSHFIKVFKAFTGKTPFAFKSKK